MDNREKLHAAAAWTARMRGEQVAERGEPLALEPPSGDVAFEIWGPATGDMVVWAGEQHKMPVGAVPVCLQHLWLSRIDGRRLECMACGLVVSREMA